MGKYYRLNDRIQARELRVIDSDGTQLGVISKEEALSKARGKNLDLVEVAPQANPPVARILGFQKFKYEESKREQAARKHAKDVELKELWFTPRIAEHDLQTRLNRVDEFIKEGDKVLLRIKFKGREMGNISLGYNLLHKILITLGERVQVEREAKMEGRSLTAIIGRAKGGNKLKESFPSAKVIDSEAEPHAQTRRASGDNGVTEGKV